MKKLSLLILSIISVNTSVFADLPTPHFQLRDPGTEEIVDYEKYGRFENAGAANCRYVITNQHGLAKAVGTGIFPNTWSVFSEPGYHRCLQQKKLDDVHWNYTGKDYETNFYKWLTCSEAPGVKYFTAALNLERAGLILQAIKTYHSIIVHFPKSIGKTFWKTPWYPAVAAGDRIEYLIRKYPELNLEWDGEVKVINMYDNDTKNDVVICNPGKLKKHPTFPQSGIQRPMSNGKKNLGAEVRTIGKGRIKLVQYENEHWQLLVDGKPFVIRGIAYSPTPIGQSPEYGTLTDWMQSDINRNGFIDAAYESWLDANKDNIKNSNEPEIGDFRLLRNMGVNTIRIYHYRDHPKAKEVLRDLYKNFGIMALMGDFVGMYARDSGATWQEGTDYRNPEQRAQMMEGIKKMVMEFKDEPFVLMWVLGNENVFGVACNANKYPVEYFQFINEIAQWIHSVDPNHPVAICNGDLLFLDFLAKHAPAIDVIGANVYRGEHGFGKSFWRAVKYACNKPVLITEFGCPAYFKDESSDFAEEWQARYHEGNWQDIAWNFSGYGYGNALGGVIFEWLDEWWKTMNFGDPSQHKIDHAWGGPFPDGHMYEEWLGLASQGNGKNSPFLRQLRKSYFLYRDVLWKK